MKLEKFDKNKKGKIIVASVVLGLFLIIGGVYLFRSHAIFEEHKTFDVIFGKVPPFKKKEKDLELAILVDGESVSEVPTDKDYRVRVECDTDEISGSWDYTNWYANISGHVTKPVICTIIFESIYDSITIDGESRNTFPEKGDYQYNMTCSNVTNYSWNEDTWTPIVTGVNKESSCNLVFKSTNNIITKITHDGVEKDGYRAKEDTGSVEIKCTNGSTGEWDREKWKPIINNVTNETTCEVEFSSKVNLYENVSVGDYVAYTPNRTSYDIENELTGMNNYSYNSNLLILIKNAGKQTINPSELNLWRVIKKNEEDGTIEIVSEYTSSNNIYFFGKEGYRRYVGTLNSTAESYETEGITVDSRCVGNTGEQATCSAYNACNDQKTSYDKDTPDTELIKVAIGTVKAWKFTGSESDCWYFLASRFYGKQGESSSDNSWHGRMVRNGTWPLSKSNFVYANKSETEIGGAFRPIVVLKSGLTATELEDKTDTNQNKTFKQWKVN